MEFGSKYVYLYADSGEEAVSDEEFAIGITDERQNCWRLRLLCIAQLFESRRRLSMSVVALYGPMAHGYRV